MEEVDAKHYLECIWNLLGIESILFGRILIEECVDFRFMLIYFDFQSESSRFNLEL